MATLKDLQAQAKGLGLKGFSKMKKDELEQWVRDNETRDARTTLSADDHNLPPTEATLAPHPITNTLHDPELPVFNGSFSHPVILENGKTTEELVIAGHARRDRNEAKRYRKSLRFGRHGARQVQTGTRAA